MTLNLFVLAPAGISLLTTETERSQSQVCTPGYRYAREGDQGKLCMQLLGQGGPVSTYLALLDGTARGVCDKPKEEY